MLDKSKIVKSTGFYFFVSLASRVVSAPKTIVLGLVLAPAEFGLYNSIFLWFFYMNIVSFYIYGVLGVSKRESAHHFGLDGGETIGLDIQNKSMSLAIMFSSVLTFVYFLYAFQKENTQLIVYYFFAGLIFLLTEFNAYYERFNSARNNFYGIARANLLRNVVEPLIIMATVFSLNIYALFIGPIISLIISIGYYRLRLPIQFKFKLDFSALNGMWKPSFFFGITTLMSSIYWIIDRTFIDIFLDKKIMGLYSFSLILVMMLQSLYINFQAVLSDSLNRSSGGLQTEFIRKTNYYNLYLLFSTLFVILFGQVFYYIVVNFLLIKYVDSISLFIILSVSLFFSIVFLMPNAVMGSKIMRKEGVIAWIMFIGVMSSIIFNGLFIYCGWKGEGIALGTVLSMMMMAMANLYAFGRLTENIDLSYLKKVMFFCIFLILCSCCFYYFALIENSLMAVMIYIVVVFLVLMTTSHFFFKPNPYQLFLSLYRGKAESVTAKG